VTTTPRRRVTPAPWVASVAWVVTVGMTASGGVGHDPGRISGPSTGDAFSARVAVPVLLVPGWFDSARDLAALRIHLIGAGWPDAHVGTLTFEEPTGSNRDHAAELEGAVARLRAVSGADSVDIVAHSMGGLAVRWYLLTRRAAPVRRAVFIASPHRGTLSAHLAWGGGRDEMMPDSPFLDTLNARAPVPSGVDAITVRTVIDTHVVPGESATLPGVPDYTLCCPTHPGLLQDRDVLEIVRSFLELGVVAREPTR
jgi:pimeloyl-ACP methyl ester carboxylesterase